MAEPLEKLISGLPVELMRVFNSLVDHVHSLEREIASLRIAGGAAGSFVARVVEPGGIPAAADADHPAVGDAMIRILGGDYVLRDSGLIVPYINVGGAVDEGRQIISLPLQNKPGLQAVVAVPCITFP
jgi:hypothetical protein